jgi:hypothetical protein
MLAISLFVWVKTVMYIYPQKKKLNKSWPVFRSAFFESIFLELICFSSKCVYCNSISFRLM